MQYPDTDLLPEDFQNIDLVLDSVANMMFSISSELQIKEPRFERWRWDVPEVRTSWGPTSWQDLYMISRNVIFLVKKEDQSRYRGVVDINAWQDEPYAGIATRRTWRNQSFSDLPVIHGSTFTGNTAAVYDTIRTAFMTVAEWSSDQLKQHHLIPLTP